MRIIHIEQKSQCTSDIHDRVKMFFNNTGYSDMIYVRNDIMYQKSQVSEISD